MTLSKLKRIFRRLLATLYHLFLMRKYSSSKSMIHVPIFSPKLPAVRFIYALTPIFHSGLLFEGSRIWERYRFPPPLVSGRGKGNFREAFSLLLLSKRVIFLRLSVLEPLQFANPYEKVIVSRVLIVPASLFVCLLLHST